MFPTPLSAYPPLSHDGLLTTLRERMAVDPFNGVATAFFFVAIVHTFLASRITALAHRIAEEHRARPKRPAAPPSVAAELLHLVGEVEVVFGFWAAVLLAAIAAHAGLDRARDYFSHTVDYTEPLFVVVIMALASTRPVMAMAEGAVRWIAAAGRGTPASWWFAILTLGPALGSVITEPGAMTICALLLARQFYDLGPSVPLKFATIGLLFVNVSIGGTLTHFAAPPVLMVSRPWQWDTPFMLAHFGWRAAVAIVVSTTMYLAVFRQEFRRLARRPPVPDVDSPEEDSRVRVRRTPAWIAIVHVLFLAWTVVNAHYPALFIGGFLFFLGFVRATAPYQSRVELRGPLLVGFFLGGLVIHGGLQAWWIQPVLASLSEKPLYFAATILTTFNDNALVTYLATLVPDLGDRLKLAVLAGAVTGGGMTVIANAPNPAGHALLARFFGGSVPPLGLALGALLPTLVAIAMFILI